jgi:hypothetical protein
MGEAKRRKEQEKNYGQVPKKAEYRGLVVSPPVIIDGTSLQIKSSQLDPQELRFALLFWDRLVWPTSNMIHIEGSQDTLFLEETGTLIRPRYTAYGDVAQGFAKIQVQAFEDLDKSEPGVWALAQGENSFLWKDNFLEADKGALVELHRAIPIPRHDVPLAEILEFKDRRKDELILLRYKLESFITEIESSTDKTESLNKSIAELDSACSNLLILGKEWQFPVYLSNIKASFSLTAPKFSGFSYAGFKLAESYGLTAATIAAGIGGAVSTLEFKGDFGLRSVKKPMSPYKYAFHINNELR